MLMFALLFLLVALSAGLFGFGFLAASAAGVAQFCLAVFVALFLLSLYKGVRGRDEAPPPRGRRA